MKSRLTGKDPDAGKDCMWEEKGTAEDEMSGWQCLLDGHEFEQAQGVGEGQGSLVATVHGVAKSRTQLSDCTELKIDHVVAGNLITRRETLDLCYKLSKLDQDP